MKELEIFEEVEDARADAMRHGALSGDTRQICFVKGKWM
jgi:hypothetical protein